MLSNPRAPLTVTDWWQYAVGKMTAGNTVFQTPKLQVISDSGANVVVSPAILKALRTAITTHTDCELENPDCGFGCTYVCPSGCPKSKKELALSFGVGTTGNLLCALC
jgi:hypothetical protein